MSFMSPQRIRDNATKEMTEIFWFHMRIMALLVVMQTMTRQATLMGTLPCLFAVFCNSLCLAERFWDIQLRSLIYWPPFCQGFFVVSRLVLVTLSIIVALLWTKMFWQFRNPNGDVVVK